MLEIPDRAKRHEPTEVVRFFDDGDEIISLVDSSIPIPSQGDSVNLQQFKVMRGSANPEVIELGRDDTKWDGEDIERKVEKTVYDIRRLEFPDQQGQSVYQHVSVIEIYLA